MVSILMFFLNTSADHKNVATVISEFYSSDMLAFVTDTKCMEKILACSTLPLHFKSDYFLISVDGPVT
jgi:hypothetical protein